jgi:menaquinone-9 beta-reductase
MHVISADVVVVGAGPAGACTATLLARDGVDVLAVDRAAFPRDKVCGDGVAPRSVAMLRRLGIEKTLLERGFRPFYRYRIVSAWGDALAAGLPTYGRDSDRAYVVPRRELDQLLVERARAAGARVWEGVRALRAVAGADGYAPHVLARSTEGEEFLLRAPIVVAADGARGSFSRTLMPSECLQPWAVGIRAYVEGAEGMGDALNFFLDRELLPGYGWIFPGGRPGEPANVGLGLNVAQLRRRKEKLIRLFQHFTGPASLAWPHLRRARLVSAPATFPLTMDLPAGCRRVGSALVTGDAANLTNPLTGEGVAYALESGLAAAAAISRALRTGRPSDLSSYEADVWRSLRAEFRAADLLRRILVKPWGNGLMVRLLRRNEALARGGMGILANTVPPYWLLRRRIWGRMLSPAELLRTILACEPARG